MIRDIKVLIADDNFEFCDMVNDFINGQPSIKVSGIANDGNVAVDMILNGHPDIVLLDLMMPSTDGFGVLTRVKELSCACNTKFIIISTSGKGSLIKKAMDMGAAGYIIKPMNLNYLVQKIRESA